MNTKWLQCQSFDCFEFIWKSWELVEVDCMLLNESGVTLQLSLGSKFINYKSYTFDWMTEGKTASNIVLQDRPRHNSWRMWKLVVFSWGNWPESWEPIGSCCRQVIVQIDFHFHVTIWRKRRVRDCHKIIFDSYGTPSTSHPPLTRIYFWPFNN